MVSKIMGKVLFRMQEKHRAVQRGVVFGTETLHLLWAMGVHIFAGWNDINPQSNLGIGKRHPGISLFYPEVPVLFTATPNASMDDGVLMDLFIHMDDLSISERGISQEGKEYYPFVCLNGHISKIGEWFLK